MTDVTQTEAFRRWFGNSVVRKGSKPKVVYHGSSDLRGVFATGLRRSPTRGETFFASDNYAMAASYADANRAWDFQNAEPGVTPLYLSVQNPLIVDWGGKVWRGTEAWIEKARKGGHDGLIVWDVLDYYNDNGGRGRTKPGTLYVWFRPQQAKSAATGPVMQSGIGAERARPVTGSGPNRGTFDPEDASILHGLGATRMSVYDNIVAQLPRGFAAMVGAAQFVDLGDGLKFRFKGSKKANLVMIKLTPRDTYDVEFFKMAKYDYAQVAIVEGVHVDQLRDVFEHMTGLRLSL